MKDQNYLPPERPPRKPGQEPSARLTLDAYVRMRRELEGLRSDGRTKMAERLLHAREFGDIMENAEYDAAKHEQGLMEARIRSLERMLKDPDIIEVVESDEVGPGTLVTLRLTDAETAADEDEDETYLVALSAEERAPGVRTVTSASPLGSALLGRRVGDRVTYEAPGGTFTYQVVRCEAFRPS
ncbi:MAG: transcription elongation factor GreA [Actinobacteria bacterium]|nr:MAG: transcription elongation factor GreA [Actinomycetota bacterium]